MDRFDNEPEHPFLCIFSLQHAAYFDRDFCWYPSKEGENISNVYKFVENEVLGFFTLYLFISALIRDSVSQIHSRNIRIFMCVLQSLIYYCRSALAVAVLCFGGAYGVVASVICTLIGKQYLAQWTTARCFYYAMAIVFGIDVKVENEHYLDNLPFIIISNHQSALDIFMLGRLFPRGCTVTAKKSLKYVPFLGWFMALSGTLFLERTNRKKSVDVLNHGLERMKKHKRALWIFPEGTRSYTTELTMLPFKKGAFHLAQQGGVPIVPIVVSNTSSLLNPKWKIFNRGCIVVKILEPIPTDNLKKEDIGKFSEKVRDIMIAELQKVGYSPAVVDTDLPPEVKLWQQRQVDSRRNSSDVSEVLSSENTADKVVDAVKEF